MITEIGDVKRFTYPRQLTSWMGMGIREYASGGKSNRLGITRQGNRYLRTAFHEALRWRFRLSHDLPPLLRQAPTRPYRLRSSSAFLMRHQGVART